MTVSTQPLAFRCSKCFQIRCSSVDCVGQSVPCELCGHANTVPEASEDRIAQGLEFLQIASSPDDTSTNFSAPSNDMTDAEIMRQAKKEMYDTCDPSALVASKTRRFLGAVVDTIVAMAVFGMAFVLAAVIAPATGSPEEPNFLALAIILGIPTMLGLIQMILVATEGRTIGKYAVNTKIVNAKGDPPGFLQGIFLRYIVNGLLGFIPFYGLIDVCVIFANETHRCIHDYLAGTYVIDAS